MEYVRCLGEVGVVFGEKTDPRMDSVQKEKERRKIKEKLEIKS